MTILNKTSEIILLAQIFGGVMLSRYIETRSGFKQHPRVLFLPSDHVDLADSAKQFQFLLDDNVDISGGTPLLVSEYGDCYQVKIYTKDL